MPEKLQPSKPGLLVMHVVESVRVKVTWTDTGPPPAGTTCGLMDRVESNPEVKDAGIEEFSERSRA